MREVSKKEFHESVGSQDACISIDRDCKYPYTILFELRWSHKLVGKIVNSYTDNIENNYPIVNKYYLP